MAKSVSAGEKVSVGNVTIMPVRDAAISGSPAFLWPDISQEQLAPWSDYLNERGNLDLNVGTFVIRSEGKTVLVDTGLGDKPRENFPQGHLLENLRTAGIDEDEVDLVVTTHLHIDHVGWNTLADGKGGWKTTFTRARYIVVRDEWDFFTSNEQRRNQNYILDSVLPLEDSGQLELVDGSHAVTADLTLVPSPGHTPAHSCVAVVSGGEKAIIIGDLAHHPLQLTETEWETVFDIDKAMACKSREQIARRAHEENALAIGGHFPWPGFGRLLQLEGRRVWQAL
jgi:glyoxylase-like metal-dependent hydrolase (beta-lactamase superfamily II)